MVNNIPVNGWPQLKDLEAVQPTLDRLDKIEAWKRTVKEETFTGDDITIENALALPARSLITEIEAIQDLHGYDHPWAGGAGKNKWPFGDFNGTYSNVPFSLAAGTYTASKTNPDVNCGLRFFYADDTSIAFTFFTSETFTLTADVVKINYSSADATTENFMIESGTTATSFAPYSNICPISGRTAAVVTRSDGDEISEDFTIAFVDEHGDPVTVYGGTINFTTGVATVTHAIHACTGEETISVISASYPNFYIIDDANNAFMRDFQVRISGQNFEIPQVSHYNGVAYADPNNIADGSSICYVGSGGNTIGFKDLRIASASDFKAYMLAQYTANTPVTFYLLLATPIELTLTPTEVQMLKGYNRVTLSDGYGTIELKALTGANWS